MTNSVQQRAVAHRSGEGEDRRRRGLRAFERSAERTGDLLSRRLPVPAAWPMTRAKVQRPPRTKNSKHEIRNSKQIQMTRKNPRMFQTTLFRIRRFGIS